MANETVLVLPVNQVAPDGPASGDLSGNYPNPTVVALQGNPVEAQSLGASQDGYVLTWKNDADAWEALPITSGSVTLMGDVTGATTSNTVTNISGSGGFITIDATITGSVAGSMPLSYGISNIVMPSDANLTLSAAQYANPILRITSTPSLTTTRNIVLPIQSGAKFDVFNHTTGGQSLQFIGSSGTGITIPNGVKTSIYCDGTNYVPAAIIIGGDLSAPSNTSQTVTGIQTTPVVITLLTTGNGLGFNGTDWVNEPLNLAGGANYVTGALPSANQAAQTMGGDVTGTTAANTVVNLTGSGGIVTIPNATTAITGSAPASDIAANTITITGHAPFASAVTHTGAGNLVLATAAPVGAGTIGTVSIVNDGYTQLQLGCASTDFIALGASNALLPDTGIIRLPLPTASTNIIEGYDQTNAGNRTLMSYSNATGLSIGSLTGNNWPATNINSAVNVNLQAFQGQALLNLSSTSVTLQGSSLNNLTLTPSSGATFTIAPSSLAAAANVVVASGNATGASAAGGNLTLKTGTPGAGGAVGTTSIVNDGYTQLQLGCATTDFIALGAANSLLPSTGIIRLPLPTTNTVLIEGYNQSTSTSQAIITYSNTGGFTIGGTNFPTSNWLTGGNITLGAQGVSDTLILSNSFINLNATAGSTFTIETTPLTPAAPVSLTLAPTAGTGGASASRTGAAISLTASAAAVASSGTAAGAAGGAITITSGAGAAGLGGTSAGGNGGNFTLNTGAGGAAAGAGVAGSAGSIIAQVGGTTVLSLGVAGVGLLAAAASVSGVTGGTTVLSAAQYLAPIIILSGTLTSASTVVFPNTSGMWFVDVGSLAGLSGTNTLTFQSGSATTTAITALITNSNIFMISTYGGNTISINV